MANPDPDGEPLKCNCDRLLMAGKGPWGREQISPYCGHSITLVACTRIDCGILRPSVLAVFKLIARSNIVGCSIGRSPGLAPYRILST